MTHYFVFLLLICTIICRGRNMDTDTPLRARLQYWLPLLPALLSLPAFPTHLYGQELRGLCLVFFRWMEKRRPNSYEGPEHGRTSAQC